MFSWKVPGSGKSLCEGPKHVGTSRWWSKFSQILSFGVMVIPLASVVSGMITPHIYTHLHTAPTSYFQCWKITLFHLPPADLSRTHVWNKLLCDVKSVRTTYIYNYLSFFKCPFMVGCPVSNALGIKFLFSLLPVAMAISSVTVVNPVQIRCILPWHTFCFCFVWTVRWLVLY